MCGILLIRSPINNIIIPLISIFILILASCIVVRFDIFHPYVWYNTLCGLYLCAYPILYYNGLYKQYGYSKLILCYGWLALSTIILICPIEQIKPRKEKSNDNKGIIEIIGVFMDIFIISVMLFIFLSGKYTHKNAIYSANNLFFKLAFILVYFKILIYIYNLCKKINLKKSRSIIVKNGFIIFFVSLITGERDYFFSYLLITLLLLFHYRKINIQKIILLIPVGIIFLPLTVSFKYFVLTGKRAEMNIFNNIFLKFLDGEFISAGRNLQILISNDCYNLFKGKMLLNDFIRIFYPTKISHQTWFNETFFSSSHTTKYGFTLIGEGYVNGGIFGIILIFLIVGILIRYLYLNSNKSSYNMAAYVYMIPLFVYAMRADIANIVSPLLKYVLLGLGVIKILEKINTIIRSLK